MIGERLRMLRKKKGLRQKELAEILNIEKANISLYELGKSDPPDNIKVEIAKYFDISLDYLLGIVDTEINCYHGKTIFRLPDDISEDEICFINEYIELIRYRRQKNK